MLPHLSSRSSYSKLTVQWSFLFRCYTQVLPLDVTNILRETERDTGQGSVKLLTVDIGSLGGNLDYFKITLSQNFTAYSVCTWGFNDVFGEPVHIYEFFWFLLNITLIAGNCPERNLTQARPHSTSLGAVVAQVI